jgi:hypothetical protein
MRRTIGIDYGAAQAIAEYMEKVGIDSGPPFRAQAHATKRDQPSTQPINSRSDISRLGQPLLQESSGPG